MNMEENSFIERLNQGIDTRLMLMVHNAYWNKFQKLDRIYNNFHVYIFGNGIGYVIRRKEAIPKDCDFILLDCSNFFSKVDLDITKLIGQKISEENNKRVTIGYVYSIPTEERIDPNISNELKIISFKNNIEDETTISIEDDYNLISIAGLITKKHNELEEQMTLKKSIN